MAARRIAQLSDLHLLSSSKNSVRAYFASLGRALNPRVRSDRAAAALRRAHELGSDHVIFSGDLTELGLALEFEAFAELLAASAFKPEQITIVPGNHDRYGHDRYGGGDGWSAALLGPLKPWARNTPSGPEPIVDLGNVRLLPLDVTRPQSVMRSAGFVTDDVVQRVEKNLRDPANAARPVVVVQHHAPFALPPLLHRLDGLIDCERLNALTDRHEAAQVMHGHLHRHIDRGGSPKLPRVLGGPAVVGSEKSIRFYDVTSDGLAPFDPATESLPATRMVPA